MHEQAGVHFHRDPGGWFSRYASGEVEFVAMRAARVAHLIATFGLEELEDAHGRFEQAYAPAFRDALRLFDDVADLLRAAARAAVPLGLLTNSAAHATAEKLGGARALRRLPVVATTDTLGFGKPDPGRSCTPASGWARSPPARRTSGTTWSWMPWRPGRRAWPASGWTGAAPGRATWGCRRPVPGRGSLLLGRPAGQRRQAIGAARR